MPLLSCTVRPIEATDFSAWQPLWSAYQVFYAVTLPEQTTRTTWQRFLDADEPVHAFVAVDDTGIVGFVTCVIHRSTWAVDPFCYLEDLFVTEACRGRRIGEALIQRVADLAREQPCARLYWHTQFKNLQAQQLYNRLAENPQVMEYRMPL